MNPARSGLPVVVDTNVVLDLLVFDDPGARALGQALATGTLCWLATPVMREELQRVLAYPAIRKRPRATPLDDAQVLARYDALSQRADPPAPCAVRCADRDDQGFIDLAAAHRAMLLSKDKAVLRLRRRLAPLGVTVQRDFVRPAA